MISSKGLRVYPNPTHGFVRMDWDPTDKKAQGIRVLSLNGEEVHKARVSSVDSFCEMSLPDLVPGMYFLALDHTTGTEYQKIIVTSP